MFRIPFVNRFLWRLLLPSLLFFSCAANTENRPDAASTAKSPVQKVSPIEDYMRISAVGDVQASENAVYFIDWSTGRNQIFRVGKDAPVPVTGETHFPDGVDEYRLSPGGRYLAVLADRGGDEQYDLYLLDSTNVSAEPRLLDGGRNVRCGSIRWADDGSFFLYRSNRRNGRDFDIWRYELAKDAPETLVEREGYTEIDDISPDGKRAAFVRYRSGSLSEMYLIDLASKEVRELSAPGRETGSYYEPRFSKDGERLFFLTDDGQERLTPATMRLSDGRTGVFTVLFAGDGEAEGLRLSPDRSFVVAVLNENGFSRLKIIDAETFAVRPGPDVGEGVVENLSLRNDRIYYVFSSALQAPDIFEIPTDGGTPVQRTFADYAGVDPSRFIPPEAVHYPTFDGRRIPAFLYRPKGYENRPAPFVIYAHGGPEAQFRPRFVRNVQYLLERGIGFLAPNVRGSSGYGKSYARLDDYKKRMDSVRDFKAAADWLAKTGAGDPKRLAITGGSYGGYVVMAAITEYPDTFRAAIDKVGIVNFVTFLQNTKPYRRKVREAEYGPLSDPEFLKSISPVHKIDRVRTPLLIVHGENDPRVPVGEARQILEALKGRKHDVQAIFFTDEGHGIAKLENRLFYYRKMADFLGLHLRPDPDPIVGGAEAARP